MCQKPWVRISDVWDNCLRTISMHLNKDSKTKLLSLYFITVLKNRFLIVIATLQTIIIFLAFLDVHVKVKNVFWCKSSQADKDQRSAIEKKWSTHNASTFFMS
jgi:hypothetical protein